MKSTLRLSCPVLYVMCIVSGLAVIQGLLTRSPEKVYDKYSHVLKEQLPFRGILEKPGPKYAQVSGFASRQLILANRESNAASISIPIIKDEPPSPEPQAPSGSQEQEKVTIDGLYADSIVAEITLFMIVVGLVFCFAIVRKIALESLAKEFNDNASIPWTSSREPSSLDILRDDVESH